MAGGFHATLPALPGHEVAGGFLRGGVAPATCGSLLTHRLHDLRVLSRIDFPKTQGNEGKQGKLTWLIRLPAGRCFCSRKME